MSFAIARVGMGDLPLDPQTVADLVSNGQTSAAGHLEIDASGTIRFTAERQQLHDDIVRNFTVKIPKTNDRIVFMLGGGPAAGKSTMLKSKSLNVPAPGVEAVEVNPDLVKERLHEYQTRVDAGDVDAARYVHEESSYLAKRIHKAALERGQAVVHDGVGVSYERVVKQAKAMGYVVKGYYAFVDPDLAVARAVARGKKTGRFVPETYIRERHRKVSQIFEDAARVLENIELYDTTDEAVLVARGSGGKLEVVDAERYARFLAIGRAT